MIFLLGQNKQPQLLVKVTKFRSKHDFDFVVINGGWNGVFYCGHLSILGCPSGDYTFLDITEILCDNQDLLQGNYNFVMENYKSGWTFPLRTKRKSIQVCRDDDDIPF